MNNSDKARNGADRDVSYASLFHAVNSVATRLIESEPDMFEASVNDSLRVIGVASDVDRVYIWENFERNGKSYCRQVYEWSENADPQQGKEFTEAVCYDDIPYWSERVSLNKTINSIVKDLPDAERGYLEIQGIKSILVLPLAFHGEIWGFIGFDDCRRERIFEKTLERMLQSTGILMVSSILRNETTKRLIKTSSDLASHERLLRAGNDVAATLSGTDQTDFALSLKKTLMTLGQCVGADKVSIWRNFTDEGGDIRSERESFWSLVELSEQEMEKTVRENRDTVKAWLYKINSLNFTNIKSETQNKEGFKELYIADEAKSLLLLPLIVNCAFWGFIGFLHSSSIRHFTDIEKDILRSGGMLIVSAIIRNEINESLVKARESALQSAKSKSEFLSRMSHEIRTPMNAIIGMTELAKKSNDIKKIRRCLETVNASSHQLLGIINDVLDMSKIDADKLLIVKREFDFEDMMRHVFNVIQVKLDEKKIQLKLDFPRTFFRKIISDELRLSQVLINLLSNAVKFTPDCGTITLKITETPVDENSSRLVIEVRDTGIGISPEMLPSVFNSFEQGDGSITRQYGGTGLGLAICKRIVELMGGEIWAESDKGAGSKFVVSIEVLWGSKKTEGVSFLRSDLRILVVDDQEDVREHFKSILSNFSLNCDMAENGYEALGMVKRAMLNDTPYDFIFLDWFMPGINGGKTAKEIQRITSGGTIIILISSADWEVIEKEAEEAGVKWFLPKPVLSSDMYNTLIKIMGGKSAQEDKVPPYEQYDWSGKRILVVDDNDINREIVAGILEDTSVSLDTAENGREAFSMFEKAPQAYDLILMDIQMPVMDGLTAAKKIRASKLPNCKSVPIIAMTANAFKEDEAASFEAGMNGHIAKPFNINEIYKILDKALSLSSL